MQCTSMQAPPFDLYPLSSPPSPLPVPFPLPSPPSPHNVSPSLPLRLLKNKPPVILGQVRVPDQLEVAKRFTVGNYPQLIVFRYGVQYEYDGPRDSEEG